MNNIKFVLLVLFLGLMTTITFAAPVDWSNSVLDDYSINIEEVPNLSELIERDFGFSTSNDYLVRYTENQLVNEGVIYGPEWSEASDAENLTRDGEVRSFFQALDNGEELCIVFRNKDNYKLSPRAIHTFAVVFDLNEDGIYNEENDWAKVFHAPWSTAPDTVLMPGQTVNSLTSEDGTCSKPLLISPTGEIIYQEVQYSAWEEDPCDSGIEGLAYGYDRENEYNYGGVSDDSLYWAGEFCVSYEELGIIPLTGNEPPPERILHTIFAVNYESTSETYDPESGWYTWPENNAHPDNLEWGQFYGLSTYIPEDIGGCEGLNCEDGNVSNETTQPPTEETTSGGSTSGTTSSGGSSGSSGSSECVGNVKLGLLHKEVDQVLAIVSGMIHCSGETVVISENSCDEEALCSFVAGSNGGNCDFDEPVEKGTHTYYACADLGSDSEDITFEEDVCEPVNQCTMIEWGACFCEESEFLGKQIGTCVDECGNEIGQEQTCTCKSQASQGNDVQTGELGGTGGLTAEAKELIKASTAGMEEDRPWWSELQSWIFGLIVLLAVVVIYMALFRDEEEPKGEEEKPKKH